MGRTGHRDWLIGGLAAAVALTGTVVAVTRHDSPLTQAGTTLAAASRAQVTLPGRSAIPAHVGMLLPLGTMVRTAADGSAQLVTRSRISYLAGGSALTVVNGAAQQLLVGSVVVDAQHGPGASLRLADGVVSLPGGSAVDADRSAAVRVGSLIGRVQLDSPDGRVLAVPALYQATMTGNSLPATAEPLRLLDDAGEAAAAPTLVQDDLRLRQLAAGVDRSGTATTQAVLASWNGTPAGRSGMSRSERVLPVVIADATHGRSAQQRYDAAVTWRRAGGSWGVVLHLLGGRANAVDAAFALDSKRLVPPSATAVLAAAAAAAAAASGGTTATTSGHPATSDTPTRTQTRTTAPTPQRTGGGTSKPTPAPSPGPVSNLLKTGQTLINKVVGLLPTAPPTGLLR